MDEKKDVFLKISVDKDGKVSIDANNTNPIDAISLCNIAIKEAIKQIQVKPQSEIVKPTTEESMKIIQ